MPEDIPPAEPLRVQVLEKMSLLVTSAFGLVAALAWNEAVKATIEQYYATGEGLNAMYAYAILVTAIAVFASIWIARAAGRARRVLARRRRQAEHQAGM